MYFFNNQYFLPPKKVSDQEIIIQIFHWKCWFFILCEDSEKFSEEYEALISFEAWYQLRKMLIKGEAGISNILAYFQIFQSLRDTQRGVF